MAYRQVLLDIQANGRLREGFKGPKIVRKWFQKALD